MNSNSYPFIIIHNFTYKNWFVFICLFCIHWRWFRSFFFINCCCYWFQRNERTELQRHDKPIGNDGICWIFFFQCVIEFFSKTNPRKLTRTNSNWIRLINDVCSCDRDLMLIFCLEIVLVWTFFMSGRTSKRCFLFDLISLVIH